jgi:di/tricarboxylate transporter
MSNKETSKYKPAVNQSTLYFLAGLSWMAVGVMLIKRAIPWVFNNDVTLVNYIIFTIALLTGVIISIFGFNRIANKNIKRIKGNGDKRCIFGFIAWKSYVLIAFMISLGIALRNSNLPKLYLSLVYNSIGTALFLSSFKYFKEFF